MGRAARSTAPTYAHPFVSLLVTLRVAGERFRLRPGAPELARLRDAYLEPWTDEHDRSTLRELVQAASHVAPISRALTWQKVFGIARPAVGREHAARTARWLARLSEPALL